MPWNLDNDKPIFIQLVERMQNDILSGQYKPGQKFPSVRELAMDAGVNPNTMQKALQELERTGLIITNRTYGRFVTEDLNAINNANQDTIKKTVKRFISDMEALDVRGNDIIVAVKGELQ